MIRPLQLSLVEGLERPVGPLLPSVVTGSNSDLIAKVAPLYIAGRVADVTYGRGMWWRTFRPANLVAHDLHKLDGVDFRDLPESDHSFDTVCFDPPYVPSGGTGQTARDYRDRYGLTARTPKQLDEMIFAVVAECARVLRPKGFLLAKCCDYTNGRKFHLGHRKMIEAGEAAGLEMHDLIIHLTGPGPGGTSGVLEVKRARRHHSYLVVMRKRTSRSRRRKEHA